MQNGFSIRANMRTYSLNFRERNYPKFEGKYNVYISVYGQLSGQYLGDIEEPAAMNVTEADAPAILEGAENFVMNHRNTPVSIW